MAREFKYFNFDASASQTIYTVPEGRNAKVTLNAFTLSAGSNILIDNVVAAYATNSSGTIAAFPFPGVGITSPTVVIQPGHEQMIYKNGEMLCVTSRVWYLGPGKSVFLSTLLTSTVVISVIEEY